MKRITLIIKIKSKENSFLNSWFESLHKRFDQYHLNDSSMQVLAKKIWALNKVKKKNRNPILS